MKKTITTFVFAIILVIAFSQNSNDTEKSNHVCVSTPQTNVLYRGVENPVCIAATGYNNDKLVVSVSEGAEIKRVDNNYLISVNNSDINSISLTVGIKENGTFKELNKTEIKVLDMPAPIVLIAGAYKDGTTIPKPAFFTHPYINVKLEYGGYFPIKGVKCEIVSFTFIYEERGVNHIIKHNSNSLSDEAIEIIKNLESGSQVSFTNIMLRYPDGKEVITNGVSVTIKDVN